MKNAVGLLARWGLATLSLLLGLLVCETGLRIRAWWQDSREQQAFERLGRSQHPDPGATVGLGDIIKPSRYRRIIYELRPGLVVTYEGAPLRTNSAGFRGPDVRPEKPPGTVRILGLGDSVMFGSGVSHEDCYLTLLGEWLNADYPGVVWEIVNTAVPGYNTVMEVEVLRVKGLRYQPDLVIIGFVGNDMYLPNFIRKPHDYFNVRTSYLLDFVRHRRLKYGSRERGDGLIRRPSLPREHQNDQREVPEAYADFVGIDAYREAMESVSSLGERHGFNVLVVARGAGNAVRSVCANLGIPIVISAPKILQYMREHGIERYAGSALTVSKLNIHPSPLGHQIIADELYQHLTTTRLVQKLRDEATL